MVYHEIRRVNGKKHNYLIRNSRENGKWVKTSKYLGTGMIAREKLNDLKKEFEIELVTEVKSEFLLKQDFLRIEKLKTDYLKAMKSLSREELEKFETHFFTELTYNSNAIEGNSLSLEDTHLVLNEGLVPEGKTLREINEARNHKKAIEFIKNYKGDLNEKLILKLHSIILQGISERFAGRYRETPVRIFGADVSFPSYEKVPQLIQNLIYWYKQNKNKMHPFELAVIFSMKFVSIHPFVDGNGRMSRLLMNFILNKNNYPWINIYHKQRAEYLKAVRKANDEEYLPILKLTINLLQENLKKLGIKK